MSSAKKVWRSNRLGLVKGLAWLVWLALLCACTPATPATPTGPLLPQDQAVQMGLSICNADRIRSSVGPELESVELTTNQAIADRLGGSPWAELSPDSPVWLVKYTGLFSIAQPPGPGGVSVTPLGPFPTCWAILEARFGARGTVYIPNK